MSLDNARRLAHNMRATAEQQGDTQRAELAQYLQELASGLDSELRDIRSALQDIRHKVQNLH